MIYGGRVWEDFGIAAHHELLGNSLHLILHKRRSRSNILTRSQMRGLTHRQPTHLANPTHLPHIVPHPLTLLVPNFPHLRMHCICQLHRRYPLIHLILQHNINTVRNKGVVQSPCFLNPLIDYLIDYVISLWVVALGGRCQCAELEQDHADCEYVRFVHYVLADVGLRGVVEDLED